MSERRHRGWAQPGAAEDELAEAVEALAVLLDAGIMPESAWRLLGGESAHPAVRRIASAVGTGIRPAEALARVAGGRADAGTRALAAMWMVAESAGAALAPALRGTAGALRDRAETAREVEAALSGPRATARLMAWLPVVGLVMAVVLGIDVLGTLVGSPAGWALAGVGGVLFVVGRSWTRRLVRRASTAGPLSGVRLDLAVIALSGGVSAPRALALVGDAMGAVGLETGTDGSLERVLRIADRAGAPAGDLLSSAATQERRVARTEGRRSAGVLSVRLLLPLGGCILPAFLLLGVAPVIVAMLSSTVSGLA